MNDEVNEYKWWLFVFVAFLLFLFFLYAERNASLLDMAERGYEQTVRDGSVIWVKVKGETK